MRIALCLSGQPRGLATAHEYIKKNLLDIHNPDVFVHSWTQGCPKETQDEIKELYAPKRAWYLPHFHKNYFAKYTRIASPKHPAFNTGHAFASVFLANELKRFYELNHGFRYDIVIKARFDYALNRILPIVDIEPGKVYVPDCRVDPNKVVCNDQFAFGTSEVMDLYCQTFQNMDRIYGMGFIFNGEDLLSGNLQINELTGGNMVYVPMNNPFTGGPWNSGTHSLVRENIEEWRRVP